MLAAGRGKNENKTGQRVLDEPARGRRGPRANANASARAFFRKPDFVDFISSAFRF